jgi:hypothetical protein
MTPEVEAPEALALLASSLQASLCQPTFRWNISPLSSGSKISRIRNQLTAIGYAVGGDKFLRNVG